MIRSYVDAEDVLLNNTLIRNNIDQHCVRIGVQQKSNNIFYTLVQWGVGNQMQDKSC